MHEWGKFIAALLQVIGMGFILYGVSIFIWWRLFDKDRFE